MQVGLIQSTEGHKNKKLMFLREEGIPRQRSVEIDHVGSGNCLSYSCQCSGSRELNASVQPIVTSDEPTPCSLPEGEGEIDPNLTTD